MIRAARELEPGDEIVYDRRRWMITMVWVAPNGLIQCDVVDGEIFGSLFLTAFQPVQCAL